MTAVAAAPQHLQRPRVRLRQWTDADLAPFAALNDDPQTQPHEIGWRLAARTWGHGYASEAAALALRHGFEAIGLPRVVSFTAATNLASQRVMQRIGLSWHAAFDHPRFAPDHPLRRHVLYAAHAAAHPAPPP